MKYSLIVISLILIVINYIFNEKIAMPLKSRADNILYVNHYDKTAFVRPSSIFKGKDKFFYAGSSVKIRDKIFYYDIVIDRLKNMPPGIIFAEKGYFKNDLLYLENGVENIIHDNFTEENKFTRKEVRLDLYTDQNILQHSFLLMNTNGLTKIIERNSHNDINIIASIKRTRHLSLLNKILFVVFVFLLFFDIKKSNIFHSFFYSIMLILFFELFEYKMRNLMLSNPGLSNYIILINFLILFFSYIFIKVFMCIYKLLSGNLSSTNN